MSGVTCPWSAVAPLPAEGTWLLEASAGTGKTWQLASLVARLVVEPARADGSGLAIGRLLLMTFTRAAAAELRERVRGRLVAVREAIEAIQAGGVAAASVDRQTDAVLGLLVLGPPEAPLDADQLAARLRNVRRALADFDQATISTIHSFSQGVLDTLAFESGQDTELSLVESTKAVRDRLAADAIASRQATASAAEMARLSRLGWQVKTLGRVANESTRAGAGRIEPAASGADDLDPWPIALHALNAWWRDTAGGQALVAMVRAELTSKTCCLNKRSYGSKTFEAAVARLEGWLDAGAGWPVTAGPQGLSVAQADKLTREGVDRALKAGPGTGPGALDLTLFDQLQALLAELGAAASGLLADFARRSRVAVEAELQRRRELSFDAMLTRLAERIEQTGRDGALAQAMANLFDVAMIDEFQDTDSAQWMVLDAVFHGRPGKRLFLVGDPKQAIYAFRGADVHVYLAAKRSVTETRRFTMTRNYRSDEAYVLALNGLWGATPGAFGALDMRYVAVDHKPEHGGWGLRAAPPVQDDVQLDGGGLGGDCRPRRPLELRWLDDGAAADTPPRRVPLTNAKVARERAAAACAWEIRALLESDATLPGLDASGQAAERALAPRDFAVLVNAHKEAEAVKVALTRHGIMAVAGGKSSVFQSPAALWLLELLDAVAAPEYEGKARRLAICPLFGWSVAELERALDDADAPASQGRPHARPWPERLDWVAWRLTLTDAAERWARQRFAGVTQALFGRFSVTERVLGLREGERLATDLRHLVELCHAAERRAHLGPVGLAAWLRQQRQVSEGDEEVGNLRLESDADAVRVVTLYKAKGLQYPIVMLPFAWGAFVAKDEPGALVVHPHGGAGPAIIDLHAPGTRIRGQRLALHRLEQRQENMRKLYVALTRAEHHCVAWFGPVAGKCDHAALNRLLFRGPGRTDAQTLMAFIGALRVNVELKNPSARATRMASRQQAETEAVRQLDALCTSGQVGWRFQAPVQPMSARYRTERESDDTSAWRVAAFNRPGLEAAWQRASFTSMVGGRQVHADEPAEADLGLQTAPAQGAVAAVVAPQLSKGEGDDRLPLAAMWGGTVVGTWVHAVFEHLSFQSDDAGALCERGQAGRPARRDVTNLVADLGQRCGHRREADRVLLLDALPHILATPLDAAPLQAGAQALPAGLCLADLSDAQRMDELDFDLSLMGGERWQPGQTLDPAAVANALRPRLAEQDWDGHTWLQALMERADDPSSDWSLLPRIAGILTGQIDLVFEAGGRLYLADYKTNRIHGADVRDCRAVHYSRPWLAWAMAGHGYHLQALLYTVALHRLLGERMGADYDYDRHLGGHLYLFVRGMTGARARLPHGAVQGVYADRWPHQVVEALDAALDPTLTPGHGRAP